MNTLRSTSTHRADSLKIRPIIPGEPRVRLIHEPHGYKPFAEFSCGSGAPETSVNGIVAAQFNGTENARLNIKVIVMETPRVGFVGMLAFYAGPLTFDVLPTPNKGTRMEVSTITVPNAAYVHAIGIEERFQMHRLEGGGRVGAFLLRAGLYHIGEAFDGEMPWTWAYVDPANGPSHRLFYEHGFGYVPPQGPQEESKRVLPKGRSVPR